MMNRYLAQVDFGALSQQYASNIPNDIGGIINVILTLFFPIAGFVLLAMLIMAGYQYMVSGGDPKILAKAKSSITYAVVGFIIIFAAYFIVNYFGLALSIKQIQEIF